MVEISVIIINYNTFQLTCDCIRSIIAFTKCQYEIIVVDNSSVECPAQLFLQEFPSIKLVESDKNLGFSKGNNLGIEVAAGEYILLLNSDTLLLNAAIDLSLERIRRDASIGALSCQLVNEDGSLQPASNEFITIRKNLARSFRLQKIWPSFRFRSPDLFKDHETDWIWGTFFMFPRKVLGCFEGKKLPDTFFMYGEDLQWSYKLKRCGYKIVYFPAARVVHLISASSASKEEDRFLKYVLPNEFIFYKLEHGRHYALLHFLSSSLFYLVSFKTGAWSKSYHYFRQGFNSWLGMNK